MSQNFVAVKKKREKNDHRSHRFVKEVCEYLYDYIKFNIGNLSIGANVHNMGCSDNKSKGEIKVGSGGNECVKIERG